MIHRKATIRHLSFYLCSIILVLAQAFIARVHASETHRKDGTLRIGLTASLTGKYKDAGRAQLNGIEMWQTDLNERGALLGKQVELVVYNDESNPQHAASLYKKLILEDRVDLLLGPYSSDITLAVSKVSTQFKFPILAIAASSNKIWQDDSPPYVFGTYVQSHKLMEEIIVASKNMGFSSLAILSENTSYTRSVAEGAKTFAQSLSLKVTFEGDLGDTEHSIKNVVNALSQSKAELVIVGAYYDKSISVVREIKQSDFQPKLIALSGSADSEEFKMDLGSAAEGVISTVQWNNDQRMPGAKDFNFRYKIKYGDYPRYQAAGGYSAGQILEAAVRLAQSTERTAIQAQLSSMKFRSLFGHYRVNDNGAQIGKSAYVMQWQDGERQLVLPEHIARIPIRYFNHQ